MNPFIAMLIQSLMNGSGTNSYWNSAFGQGLPDQSNNYGNDFITSMFGQSPANPFIFSPFPSYGQGLGDRFGGGGFADQVRRNGIGRQIGRTVAPGQQQTPPRSLYPNPNPTIQPYPNEQPVPIPAPPLPVPPRNPFGGQPNLQPLPNQPTYDDPGANNPGGPIGPMILPPFQAPPRQMVPPDNQFFIEPLPGIRIPINMTGLPGGNQAPGLPGRLPQDINYLPVPPRNLGGMLR